MNMYQTPRWIHLARMSALGCAGLYLAACTNDDALDAADNAKTIGENARDAAESAKGGVSGTTSRARSTSSGGYFGYSGIGGASSTSLAGAASNGSAATAGTAGTPSTTVAKSCVVSSELDAPDIEGIDTNCDGIDGNAASSVFVSPDGLDSSDGTQSDPVRSIGKALQLAQKSNGKLKDVLICSATYRENVVVADSGVGLHGGYDCTAWKRNAAASQIAPTAGVALRIANVTDLEISKLDLQSADATAPGESSQAVQVVSSKGVRIVGSNIVAGRGAPGANAPLQTKTWTAKAKKGAAGQAAAIGSDGSIGCHLSSSTTDVDFDGHIDKGNDAAESRCLVRKVGGDDRATYCNELAPQAVKGGKGGDGAVKAYNVTPTVAQAGAIGTPERPAPRATAGTPGASFGSLSEKGYEATNKGTDGVEGQPGLSGRGGMGGGSCLVRSGNIEESDRVVSADLRAGFTCDPAIVWGSEHWTDYSIPYHGTTVTMFPGTGGGQGGYGGCGGYAGFGGGAGGASIALVVFDSEVALSRCNVKSSNGGKGGAASAGTAGQAGGEGGDGGAVLISGVTLPTVNGKLLFPESQLRGAPGANGNNGEVGGPGGAGGGGPSIGILWSGATEPVRDITVTVTAGVGGDGGTPAASGDPGKAGLHGDVVKAPTP